MTAKRSPKYRKQKRPRQRAQAFVEIRGKRFYLGEYGTPESRQRYHHLLAECDSRTVESGAADGVTIIQIIARFWEHCENYYRTPDGRQTSEVDNFRQALRPLKALYGYAPAVKFGPSALKVVRRWMIEQGWCRTNINKQVNRLRHVFKWAAGEELLPASIHQALACLGALKAGRCDARETEPQRPVMDAQIAAVKPFVSRQVWALIQLQILTGARAGELVGLRAIDVDTRQAIWTFSPRLHKNAYRGQERTIYFGPRAQTILAGFMSNRSLDAHLFSPRDALQERSAKAASHRRRHQAPTHRISDRRVNDHYTTSSYRRAIARACIAAHPHPDQALRPQMKDDGTVETDRQLLSRLSATQRDELCAWRRRHQWHPHQLRHNAGTDIRRQFGIEAAQVMLGHARIDVTQLYAEASRQKATEVAASMG